MPFRNHEMRCAVVNGVMFNITWLAIIQTQSNVLASVILILHLAAHFLIMGKGFREVQLVVLVSIFGAMLDQTLFLTGVFNTNGHFSYAPFWLMCLWPALATTLMHAFSRLHEQTLLAASLGAAGAASSYLAGTHLTDIDFGHVVFGPLLIALIWAGLFPLLIRLANRFSLARELSHAY